MERNPGSLMDDQEILRCLSLVNLACVIGLRKLNNLLQLERILINHYPLNLLKQELLQQLLPFKVMVEQDRFYI
ncbi:MAG: hypothetical protein DWI25_03030 [Planctomycetota bacterium]|nr:MAG: hypothetical protein DWI25_03030 [Planctomycetota bacterium]